MLSLSFVLNIIKLLLKYPKSISSVVYGLEEVPKAIDRLRREEWNKIRKCYKSLYITKKVQGINMLLSVCDVSNVTVSIVTTGWYEPAVTELFKKIIKGGMTVVDVGANIGYYTLLAAKLVQHDGKVYAFEPEPINYLILSKAVQMNKFSNVKVFRYALSDRIGYTKLYVSNLFSSHSIVYKNISKRYIMVPTVTLDYVISKEKLNIDLLKIDVEGAEPYVISGGINSINNMRNIRIIMEYSPSAWKKHRQLLKYLFKTFRVYEIINSPLLCRRIYHPPTTKIADIYLTRET